MRPPGSPEELERRRVRAVALLEEGYQPVDIARRVGVDRRSVRRWKRAFLREGHDSIKARPVPGRPPRLDAKDKSRLEKALLRGARPPAFPPTFGHALGWQNSSRTALGFITMLTTSASSCTRSALRPKNPAVLPKSATRARSSGG